MNNDTNSQESADGSWTSTPAQPWKLNNEKLLQMKRDSESADKRVFAEMRSSLLLIAGDHYARMNQRFYERIRTTTDLSNDTKVRLTKNHVGRIHKIYVNNILTYCPGVFVSPKDETQVQDRKAAELDNSVWQDAKVKLNYDDQIQAWADDFVGISEVWTKCYFDPMGGDLKGYEQKTNELGEPEFDEAGQPVADKKRPVFRGKLCYEEIHGFNVFRDATAKSLHDSPWFMHQKMVPVARLNKMFPGQDKAKFIQSSADKTFLVFDNSTGGYRKSDTNECLVYEWFFKASPETPEGYYIISTETGILDEGPLPFGIFPLEGEIFDRIPTTPRGRGIVKQLRPYQIEINRCASKIAEHQMTLGDDKLIMFNGSKLSAGGQVPGVRGLTVSGTQAPTVLAGRAGNQFVEHMKNEIAEMYQVAMVNEDSAVNPENGQLDPYAMLFKSASQRKVFKRYITRFENFLKRSCRLYLRMAKVYLPDDEVIVAIGKKEQINISEFKNNRDIDSEVKLDARTDDIETLMGQQLVMNHLIQYAGNQLSREDIGKMMKQMPYANVDESFSDFTMDFDASENLILALDRGERPEVSESDPQEYLVKKLDNRMRQPDFKLMHSYIQGNYKEQRDIRLQLIEQMRQRALRDQAGMIPASGALIDAGIWIPDPQDPAKTRRLRLPEDAVAWLFQKLQDQGYMQAQLAKMGPELNSQRVALAEQNQQPQLNGQPQMQGPNAGHGVNPMAVPQN